MPKNWDILKGMSLEQLATTLRDAKIDAKDGRLDEQFKLELDRELGQRCSMIGRIWDELDDVDSTRGPKRKYGTRNRSSHTYKLRKAAGFAYP